MNRPTDYMFTVTTYVTDAANAWGSVRARAVPLAFVGAVAATFKPWTMVPVAVVLFITLGLRVWWTLVRDVLEAQRQHDAKSGHYADAVPRVTPTGVLLALPLVIGMLLPGLAPVAAAFLVALAAADLRLALRRSAISPAGMRAWLDQTLWMFLAYPDRSYATPTGWAGVWTPDAPLHARHGQVSGVVGAVFFFAFTGLGLSLRAAAQERDFAWWLPAANLVACVGVMATPRRWMRLSLARPYRGLHEGQEFLLPPARTDWERAVNLVTHSTHEEQGVRLQDHLFAGYYAPKHTEAAHPMRVVTERDCPAYMPALVHDGAWRNHIHYTGPTQSGKTTLGVLSLVCQAVRGRVRYETGEDGAPLLGLDGRPLVSGAEHVPILVLDFKGDPALRATLAEECARFGRVYREFTLEPGKATAYFNPILDLDIDHKPCVEFCEMVCSMLGLFHGLSYGKGYYSRQHRDLLIHALRNANPKPRTWEEVSRAIQEHIDPTRHRDAFELLASILAVAMHAVVGPAPSGVQQIHMPTAMEERHVVYFRLPATVAAYTVREVGRMALFCWLDAATRAAARGGARRSLVVMDEAQIICGEQIQTIFQQASAAGMTVVLSNQSIADLDTQGVSNMSQVVRDNTRVKQCFGMLDLDEARRWEAWSGQSVGYLYNYSGSTSNTNGTGGCSATTTTGWSANAVLHPRLPLELVWQTNNDPNASLLHVAASSGFTQLGGAPVRVWSPFTMTADEYARRSREPWPDVPWSAPAVSGGLTTVVNAANPANTPGVNQAEYAELEALYARLAAQLGSAAPSRRGGR